MAWTLLFVAGLFEIGFAMGLKYSEGFTRPWPTIFMFASGGLSFWLLSLSMKTLPVGTAYAVWTGIGAVGTVVLGIVFLKESSDLVRLLSILLILAGIVGLRLSSPA
jgi:quaternary ammonium compound-resistance protein SugE